jgi:hypothetical protein
LVNVRFFEEERVRIFQISKKLRVVKEFAGEKSQKIAQTLKILETESENTFEI